MKKFKLVLLVCFALLGFTNCNSVKLDNQDAESLVINTLGIPVQFWDSFYGNYNSWGRGPFMHGAIPYHKIYAYKEDGLITLREYHKPNNGDVYLNVEITESGKPYYMDVDDYRGIHRFKTYIIDFNQISGISINKEQQTATVRFSLIAKDITPFAYSLIRIHNININDQPITGELVYKKFDTGWQLQNGQNKSSTELLNEILNIER